MAKFRNPNPNMMTKREYLRGQRLKRSAAQAKYRKPPEQSPPPMKSPRSAKINAMKAKLKKQQAKK